jgi:hypothetical protein
MTEGHLRPEARAVLYRELGTRQREAFSKVLDMLSEVLDQVNAHRHAKPAKYRAGWQTEDRSSRVAFLSGGRGTGKTTVLLSLARELMEAPERSFLDDKHFVPPIEVEHLAAIKDDFRYKQLKAESKERALRIEKAVEKLASNVVWLEPLDIEATPTTSNLLAAILSRIENAALAQGAGEAGTAGRTRGLFDRGSEHHKAFLELQRLQADVALAWDGNLKSRAGHLDPDVYALEVMRAEQARLHLYTRMSRVLDTLAEQIVPPGAVVRTDIGPGPIFLLPIDDFDISPSMCLPTLRMLRMISVPRLFALILGDVSIARYMLNLKIAGDMVAVTERADRRMLPIPAEDVGSVAGEIASNALRKLAPPNQRIRLAQHTPREGLNFRPLGHAKDARMLHTLLAALPLELEVFQPVHDEVRHGAQVVGRPVRSLLDFLLFARLNLHEDVAPTAEISDRQRIGDERVAECAYSAIEFLRSPLRRLTDFWFELEDLVAREGERLEDAEIAEAVGSQRAAQIVDFFGDYCRQALEEDRALASVERQVLPLALGQSKPRMPDFDLLPLVVRSAPTSRRGIVAAEGRRDRETIEDGGSGEMRNGSPFIVGELEVSGHRAWRYEKLRHEMRETGDTSEASALLSVESASALTLYHDLFMLTTNQSQAGRSRLSPGHAVAAKHEWAVVRWQRRGRTRPIAEFRWPLPGWQSFWEFDVFLQTWTDAISGIGWTKARSLEERKVERLGYVWIATATAILGGAAPRPLPKPASTGSDEREVRLPSELWHSLIYRIGGLVAENSRNTRRGRRLREWATRIALFTFPEYGLSAEARTLLADAVYSEDPGLADDDHEARKALRDLWRVEGDYLRNLRIESEAARAEELHEVLENELRMPAALADIGLAQALA